MIVEGEAVTADQIVSQAIEQAGRIESRIADLRARRRELQIRLGHLLTRFKSFLDEDEVDERENAPVRTLPRRRSG